MNYKKNWCPNLEEKMHIFKKIKMNKTTTKKMQLKEKSLAVKENSVLSTYQCTSLINSHLD